MEKEIAYTGQTAAPSDYDCVDGTLAMSMNLWTENGSAAEEAVQYWCSGPCRQMRTFNKCVQTLHCYGNTR